MSKIQDLKLEQIGKKPRRMSSKKYKKCKFTKGEHELKPVVITKVAGWTSKFGEYFIGYRCGCGKKDWEFIKKPYTEKQIDMLNDWAINGKKIGNKGSLFNF